MTFPQILIVDDEPETLKLLTIIFEKEGYEVFSESNGSNIIQKIIDLKPDIIILDMLMPDMNGLDVLKLINSKYSNNFTVPIIALTSYQNLDMKLSVLKEGVIDYLQKPFHKDELLYKVKNIIGLKYGRNTITKVDKDIIPAVESNTTHNSNSITFNKINFKDIFTELEVYYVASDVFKSKLKEEIADAKK